jgi:diamine N-acetyltransferase
MVHLEKVNGGNIYDIIELEVHESQRKFVSDNKMSIVDAYGAMTGGGNAFPFGIYDDDTPVGFLMIGFDVDEYWEDYPGIAVGSYNIWRLMIDRRYQGREYGKAAMKLALDFIRTYPCGEAEKCWLSYDPENYAAERLYSSFGFEPNGEKDGDEIIAVLEL